ncbi:quinon protein alcohol dehydrogenase-like superfamily [Trametes punicea]|nr:quinon protein alcohol dehydrogenase-like superfamily [Trametes punicea]
MATQLPWLARLDCLATRFQSLKSSAFQEPDRKAKKANLQKTLMAICGLVRDAEKCETPQLWDIVEKAHGLLAACLRYAYSELGDSKPLSTFAHSEDEPWIDDVMENAGSDIVDEFIRLYSKTLRPGSPAPKLPAFAQIRPWTKSPRVHSLSTRLSRFRPGIIPTATPATPLALIVADARAQLSTDLIPKTHAMAISARSSILALASGSGWKARDPVLHYYLLDTQTETCLEGVSMDPGLSNVPRFVAADEDRKLVFLADDDRVKSFSFAQGNDGQVPKLLTNTHTLDSERMYNGPIAVLPSGQFIRAGKGKAAIWDISQLGTHQDHPEVLIGGHQLNTDNSWREEGCTTIEMSSGSKPHTVIAFADDPCYTPATWHLHPRTGHLLCGDRAATSGGYACVALDLEHGGRRAARYLGHGGDVVRIATSAGNPNLFVTAASDGYARLFDVRRPLPVLTVETSIQHEACVDVVLVYHDGIPTLFTAGDRTQQVKMWDIREQECVYELSTGNNAVSAMAWDEVHSSLYVATECPYVNQLGERAGYRRARVPTWATWASVEKDYKAYKAAVSDPNTEETRGSRMQPEAHARGYDDNEDEDDDDVDEIDEAYSADMRWPEKCFHKENYFGYAYDAGEHVIFRWHFKEQPDITQLPASTTVDL